VTSPLGAARAEHERAAAARRRAEHEAEQVWKDTEFRALQSRILVPLEHEDRQYAGALAAFDTTLARALSLLNG
jgi:hypothetical protein